MDDAYWYDAYWYAYRQFCSSSELGETNDRPTDNTFENSSQSVKGVRGFARDLIVYVFFMLKLKFYSRLCCAALTMLFYSVFSARQHICLARYAICYLSLSVCVSDGCVTEKRLKSEL